MSTVDQTTDCVQHIYYYIFLVKRNALWFWGFTFMFYGKLKSVLSFLIFIIELLKYLFQFAAGPTTGKSHQVVVIFLC